MSKKYPYVLDHPCPVCQSQIVVTRKRKKIPEYCSVECYNSTIQKHTKIITSRTCPQCKSKFNHHKNRFCSKKCSNQYKAKPGPAKFNTCSNCQNQYQLRKDLGNYYSKYCSRDCFTQAKITKYDLDDSKVSTDYYLLGQIWSSALVKDLLEVRLYSSEEILKSVSQALATNYKIRKTRSEVWDNYFQTTHTITIYHRAFIGRLLELGLESPLYREWPQIPSHKDMDFLSGYCDSVKKIIKSDEIWFWMISRSFARSVEDKFGGLILYTEGNWWWIRKI